jgi:hypothetical protein
MFLKQNILNIFSKISGTLETAGRREEVRDFSSSQIILKIMEM